MAKKKQQENETWFEIRLEKPLTLEVGGELYELFAGKQKTVTNNIELVREAQRLGAEVKVLKDIAEGFLEELIEQGRLIAKGITALTPLKKNRALKPEPTPKPPVKPPVNTKKEEASQPKDPEELKRKLTVDISKLSPEEREKLKELLGE